MRDSAVGINLRLILILVVSIHIFGNMLLWENAWVNFIFARIRGCQWSLLVPVYWSYMETSFVSMIKSCLNGQKSKTSFDFSFLIPNEHAFTSFSCPYKVKTPYRPAISAFLQLGHEVMPNYREKNLKCTPYFWTNFEKQQLWKAACVIYIYDFVCKFVLGT